VADSVQPIWPPRDTVKAAPASALGKAPASVTAKPAEPVVPVPEKTVEPAPAPKPFVPAIPAVPAQQTAMELPGQETVLPEAAPWRIAGEVLNTYIICEDDAETLWLIDKHAAHERMNFDRLMTSKEPPMRQTLLQPIAVEPGKEDAALLLDNLELLEQFGFGCEDFGDGAILVREVPADLDAAGTAAVGDVANDETAFGVKSRSRMRYHTFAEVFGLHTTDARGVRGLLRHPATSLTPHSLYSLQDGVLRSLAAEGDGPLSIHFMESPAEGELFERRGALWEWYGRAGFTCDFLGYGSPAKRLVASVPPDRSVVLVHDCCVGQRDIDLIMEHFTAPVYWCLCPRSNRYISRLEPPVELLRRNGLNICLGTDSLASNDRLSVLEEMKLLSGVPLPELLGWATAGGASALGMDDMGRVAVGLRPGLSVITGIDYGRMTLTAASAIRRLA